MIVVFGRRESIDGDFLLGIAPARTSIGFGSAQGLYNHLENVRVIHVATILASKTCVSPRSAEFPSFQGDAIPVVANKCIADVNDSE